MIAGDMNFSKGKNASDLGSTVMLYLTAFALGVLVCQSFHDLGLSTCITLGVAIQCFAYSCLRLKISQQNSVAGISAQTLILQALAFALRLCSTTWLKGYIPVDGTGDGLYQVLDVSALILVLNILYCIFKSHRNTYQEEQDSGFKVEVIALTCFVFAVFVHPDLTSHFVGATALSRAVTLIFWYHGFAELAPLDG